MCVRKRQKETDTEREADMKRDRDRESISLRTQESLGLYLPDLAPEEDEVSQRRGNSLEADCPPAHPKSIVCDSVINRETTQ